MNKYYAIYYYKNDEEETEIYRNLGFVHAINKEDAKDKLIEMFYTHCNNKQKKLLRKFLYLNETFAKIKLNKPKKLKIRKIKGNL